MRTRTALITTTLAATALLAACSSGGGDTPEPTAAETAGSSAPTTEATSGGGSTQTANLKDFTIALQSDTIDAGSTTFNITNDGPSTHEFEIIETEMEADALPVESGVVNTDDMTIVDEVEDIVPGSAELT